MFHKTRNDKLSEPGNVNPAHICLRLNVFEETRVGTSTEPEPALDERGSERLNCLMVSRSHIVN